MRDLSNILGFDCSDLSGLGTACRHGIDRRFHGRRTGDDDCKGGKSDNTDGHLGFGAGAFDAVLPCHIAS